MEASDWLSLSWGHTNRSGSWESDYLAFLASLVGGNQEDGEFGKHGRRGLIQVTIYLPPLEKGRAAVPSERWRIVHLQAQPELIFLSSRWWWKCVCVCVKTGTCYTI